MTDQYSRTFRGDAHQKLIQMLLANLKKRKYIKDFTFFSKTDRRGYPGLKDQFYFPFLIEYDNGDKWIIQSSTTFPRERMNGYQWNAQHFKEIDSTIKKALVIYPDAMQENDIRKCVRLHNDISDKKILSYIDGVVSFAELYMMIEEKWLSNSTSGHGSAMRGTAFEKWLIDILTHTSNKDIWNGNGNIGLGFNYPFFEKILIKFGVPGNEIISTIEATDNISSLPGSGGKPKTDVLVKIHTDENSYQHSISSKRTNSKWVSIHQYKVEDYINVLKIEEESLKDALKALQRTGAPTQISDHEKNIISTLLPKYFRALAEWAYAGTGGSGDITQRADHFTVYKNQTKELEIYEKEEYIEKILSEVTNGQFGSPFQFTYTGKRGSNIQLKGKVI